MALVQALAPGRPLDVFAHSLGARVALAALPHLDRAPERMILLGAAELAPRAEAFVAARRAAEPPAIYNVTARTNDLYDLAFECFVPRRGRGERAVGAGLADLSCWLDLQLDRPEVTAWANAQGVALSPETARCCHWSFYTRAGALALYQAILRRRPGWDLASLRRLPCFEGQDPRWSRLLPRRRPALPRLDPAFEGALDGPSKRLRRRRLRAIATPRRRRRGAGNGLPGCDRNRVASRSRQSSRWTRSLRSWRSCASRLRVAIGRASRRFSEIGSPVSSQ